MANRFNAVSDPRKNKSVRTRLYLDNASLEAQKAAKDRREGRDADMHESNSIRAARRATKSRR